MDGRITMNSLGLDPTLAIGLWAIGHGSWGGDLSYGADSTYVTTMRQRPETQQKRAEIINEIVTGTPPGLPEAGYTSGSFLDLTNGNMWRDVCSFATYNLPMPSCVGFGSRELAALGSYSLKVKVRDYDPVHRTATINYDGENFMTLGSAFGIKQEWRPWLDSLNLPGGIGAKQRQTFNWQERISWQ